MEQIQSVWPVIWAVLVYLVALLGFRLFTIAQPARKLLSAEIESVALKLHMDSGGARKNALAPLVKEIDAIRASQQWTWDEYLREPLFWSGGRELSAWRRLHEIERHLVLFLAPSERVIQRALTVEAQLRPLATPAAIALANRLRRTLDAPQDVRSIELLKHQLAEAVTYAYNEQDNKFVALMEWHNKAMWMVTLALLIIVALSMTFGQIELFLLGAVGGLLSRMMRSLHREDVPTDYGASWTTLFLSPLLGAIAAWFGIAAIDMLGDMQIVGGVLATIEWEVPVTNAVTMFTAFLLGFSERLFMSLLTTVEGRVSTEARPAALPAPRAAVEAVARAAAHTDLVVAAAAPAAFSDVVEDLDLVAGERVLFVGDSMSPLRSRLLSVAGSDNLIDATPGQVTSVGAVDAILLEGLPDMADLDAAAAACARALKPDGRVLVVGSTPAGLYDASARAQAQQNIVGPAALHAAFTAAGLLSQEPPERLAGGDPVQWSEAFRKPGNASTD